MTSTLVAALLPVIITLLLGFVAGWHHDFDSKQAGILNNMVMLYALPLCLFSGMVGLPRDQIITQWPLGLAIIVAMVGSYVAAIVLSRYVFRRDIMTASLQAFAVSGPAAAFVGIPVLGQLFGNEDTILIAIASIVINVIQVPVTLIFLSSGQARANVSARKPTLSNLITGALFQPLVWAPLLALAFVFGGLHLPVSLQRSFALLGNATGGVALFASGIILFAYRITLNIEVALVVLGRNIVVPAACLAVMLLLGMKPDISREAVITLALPAVTLSIVLAVRYGVAEQQIASVLFFSSVLSFPTIAAFVWITT